MATLQLAGALLLAAVFAVAGIAKLRDPAGSRVALRAFGTPAPLAPSLARMLPVVELALAALLVLPATRVAAATAALGLLLAFTAVIAVTLARGEAPACNCFGQLHSAPTSTATLLRNGILAALAGGLVAAGRQGPGASPWGWVAGWSGTELVAAGGAVAVVAVTGLAGAGLVALLRSYGRVLVRLETVERALDRAGLEVGDDGGARMSELGLDPGTPAPAIALSRTDGRPATLDTLLGQGRPALLVFTSPGCGPCHALLPALARWQHDLGDRLTVAVAGGGALGELLELEREHALAPMLLDADHSLADAYLVSGTPSAVLIAPDGTIASYLASGAEEIESLLERTGAPPLEEGLPVGSPAPGVSLREADGTPVPVVDPSGRDTVILFWNPACGYCQDMLPGLHRWERDGGDRVRLVVVTTEVRSTDGFRSVVAVDPGLTAADAFAAAGTPTAVVVDADGVIASHVLVGRDAVLTRLAGAPAGLERR